MDWRIYILTWTVGCQVIWRCWTLLCYNFCLLHKFFKFRIWKITKFWYANRVINSFSDPGDTDRLSHPAENMDSNVTARSTSQDSPLSIEYEHAMEALSSLINSKKRGEKHHKPGMGSKYKKLERMSMYIKVRHEWIVNKQCFLLCHFDRQI